MLIVTLIQIPQSMQETSRETADWQQIIGTKVRERRLCQGFLQLFYKRYYAKCLHIKHWKGRLNTVSEDN